MRTHCRFGFAVSFVLLVVSGATLAASGQTPGLDEVAGRYTIMPSSRIAFAVDQVGGGGIKGVFGKFSGADIGNV